MPLKMLSPSRADSHPLAKIGQVVAIAAGKGGVGKSTVTANLALALQSAGYGVGVLDADLYGPSIRQMLPEYTLPQQKGDLILPALTPQGIQMISLAFFRRGNEAVAVRAPIANGVIAQFIKNIQWRSLDFLLIDFPPGTGDIQLTLCQQANLSGAVLVTTPQEVALMDVRKAAHLFEQTKVPLIGVVENMSYYQHADRGQKTFIFGEGGGQRLSEELGAPFLGEIPIDPLLCRHGDAGKSIFAERSPTPPAAAAFEQFAKQFVAHSAALKQGLQEAFPSFDISWKDNHTFTIRWSDGVAIDYKLSDLQKQCPCAGCRENRSSHLDPQVRATSICNVGRYALRIQFTSGCSMGIYSFALLRQLGGSHDG